MRSCKPGAVSIDRLAQRRPPPPSAPAIAKSKKKIGDARRPLLSELTTRLRSNMVNPRSSMRLFDRGGSAMTPWLGAARGSGRRHPQRPTLPSKLGGAVGGGARVLLLPRARAWRSQRSLTMRSAAAGAIPSFPQTPCQGIKTHWRALSLPNFALAQMVATSGSEYR